MSKRSPLFLGFVIIAAIFVVGLVSWSASQQPSSDTATTTNVAVVNTNTSTKVDSKTKLGDHVALLKEAAATEVGTIETYRFNETDTLNIMPEAMRSAVLNETPVQKEEVITVGGVEAKKLTITSAKDGSEGMVVQVIKNGNLYDFRGSDDFLANLSDFITFTNNIN